MSLASPAVSVVLSAYNPRYLQLAVESILRQSFTDFEFVIVDDSVDLIVPMLLGDCADQDPRIIVSRNDHNIGQAPSLNKGLTLARGKYIARQDDDDISMPDRLAQQVAFLDTHPQVGVVGTQVDIIDTGGALLDGSGFFYPEVQSQSIQQQLLVDCCLCHGSVMMRRADLNAVNGYDVTMAPAEDYDLWLRLSDLTQIARLEGHLYQFRYSPDSVSEKLSHHQLLRKADALERAVFRRFGGTPPRDTVLPLGRHYLRAAVSNYLKGNLPATRHCLSRALLHAPELFDPLETYVPFPLADDDFTFAESVFADLPPTRRHTSASNRLRSRLHMRRVFESALAGDELAIETHLWRGLQFDPTWLLNQGVLSISIKSVLRRVRATVSRSWPKSQPKRRDS